MPAASCRRFPAIDGLARRSPRLAIFDGSLAQLVSFFSRHENISAREMDEILEIMRNAKK